MEALFEGFSHILTPVPFLLVLLGTSLGIVGGAIPGITGAMMIALTLPLTFYMEPVNAHCIAGFMYVGAISGGLITATLLRMPGTPAVCYDDVRWLSYGPVRTSRACSWSGYFGLFRRWHRFVGSPVTAGQTPVDSRYPLWPVRILQPDRDGDGADCLRQRRIYHQRSALRCTSACLLSMPGVDPASGTVSARITWDWYHV